MTTILHFSDLYEDEGWSPHGGRHLDLRHIEGTARYCSDEATRALSKLFADLPDGGLRWIDTGDFHYISKLLMQGVSEPFILALYDNHSDDQPGAFDGDLLSCGNWVRAAREGLPLMMADRLNTPLLPDGLPVYLSIDIDVLSPEYARTGWSQGDMTLPQLLGDLKTILSNHRIIAVDICGGITAAQGGRPEDFAINYRLREVLQQTFETNSF